MSDDSFVGARPSLATPVWRYCQIDKEQKAMRLAYSRGCLRTEPRQGQSTVEGRLSNCVWPRPEVAQPVMQKTLT